MEQEIQQKLVPPKQSAALPVIISVVITGVVVGAGVYLGVSKFLKRPITNNVLSQNTPTENREVQSLKPTVGSPGAILRELYGNYDYKKRAAVWKPTGEELIQVYKHFLGIANPPYPDKNYLFDVRIITTQSTDDGKFYAVLTKATAEGNDYCHPCSAILGGAIYEWRDGRWVVETKQSIIDAIGSFGDFPNPDIIPIGPKKTGFHFTLGYAGTGAFNEDVKILGLAGNRLRWIIELNDATYGEYDSYGYRKYGKTSTITFIRGSNSEYYDLKVVSEVERTQESEDTIKEFEESIYQWGGLGYEKIR